MPKLCKAACHLVHCNFVTISGLLRGKQIICWSNCTDSKRVGTTFMSQVFWKLFLFLFSLFSCPFSLFPFWVGSPEACLLCFYQGSQSSPQYSSWTFDGPPLDPLPAQSRVQAAQQIRLTHSCGAEPCEGPGGGNSLLPDRRCDAPVLPLIWGLRILAAPIYSHGSHLL